jgi:transcriptional regulator
MYIPKNYEISDNELSLKFIEEFNFAQLICNGPSFPIITHLPIFYAEGKLITHLAKANPQWQVLEKNKNCTLIFNGPHGYVSPSNYSNTQNVPTWNYMTVHVNANANIIHDAETKKKIMHHTISTIEKDFLKQYDTLDENYLNAMYDAIVAIEFEIIKTETKFKLSQNLQNGCE